MPIISVGHAITDLFFEVEPELLERFDLKPGSMSLVDARTANEVLQHLEVVKCTSGGSAANTAVGLSMLGIESYFYGSLGDDEFGRSYIQDLSDAGVLYLQPGAMTSATQSGHCIVLVTPDGQRTMLTHLGASIEVASRAPILDEQMSSIVIYLEGYLLDSPGGTQMLEHLVSTADSNVRIALSLSDPGLVERHRTELWQILRHGTISVLFGNRDEVCELTQTHNELDALDRIREFVAQGAITLGPAGSIVFDQKEIEKIEAVDIQVLDTTGAGDLFAAGYLFALEANLALKARGQVGSLCSAEIISHLGARPMTDLREIIKQSLPQYATS